LLHLCPAAKRGINQEERTMSDTSADAPKKARRRSEAKKRHGDADTPENAAARTEEFLALLDTLPPEGLDFVEALLKEMVEKHTPGAPRS
jgi:hypothetical protein